MSEPVQYYKRSPRELLSEAVMGEKWIRWAYQNAGSGMLVRCLFSSGLVSRLMGLYYDSRLSHSKIQQAIEELDIDPSEFLDPVDRFHSFNQFFTRRLKPECRPADMSEESLVSPADGRILVFPKLDAEATAVPVKGRRFTAGELLNREAPEYANGSLAVVRLCPADYHRFHFPCSGTITEQKDINGAYHSVNPIALATGLNVFGENKRAYNIIQSPQFGKVCFMEVGAFGVGSIVQTFEGTTVEKMQEKGYFTFGGSTIILIFEPQQIEFSGDLVENSAEGYETLVKVGETIATKQGD